MRSPKWPKQWLILVKPCCALVPVQLGIAAAVAKALVVAVAAEIEALDTMVPCGHYTYASADCKGWNSYR